MNPFAVTATYGLLKSNTFIEMSHDCLKEAHRVLEQQEKGVREKIEAIILEYLLPKKMAKATIDELHGLVIARDFFNRPLIRQNKNATLIQKLGLNQEQYAYIMRLDKIAALIYPGPSSRFRFQTSDENERLRFQWVTSAQTATQWKKASFHEIRNTFVRKFGKKCLFRAFTQRDSSSFSEVMHIEGIKLDTPSIIGDPKSTWLHLACISFSDDEIEMVKTILSFTIAINAQDSAGKTALHKAAKLGKVEIVRLLLDAEIDSTIQDKVGRTALEDLRQDLELYSLINTPLLAKGLHNKLKETFLLLQSRAQQSCCTIM